ncbi:hypothetical protein JCM9803A_00160 [Rhodococcus erythropolis]
MRQRSEDRTSVDKANRALRWLLLGWSVGNVAVWWIHLARRSSREVQVSLISPGPFGERTWIDMGGFLAYCSLASLLAILVWYILARR